MSKKKKRIAWWLPILMYLTHPPKTFLCPHCNTKQRTRKYSQGIGISSTICVKCTRNIVKEGNKTYIQEPFLVSDING